MQNIQIIGNVGSDSVVNEVNGRKAINFRVACNERYTDKDGQKHERTNWYSCAIWRDSGKSVEISKYLKKGTKVYVSGTPSVSLYKTTDGNNETRADLKINVGFVELLSSNDEKQGGNNSANTANQSGANGNSAMAGMTTTANDDDLPF